MCPVTVIERLVWINANRLGEIRERLANSCRRHHIVARASYAALQAGSFVLPRCNLSSPCCNRRALGTHGHDRCTCQRDSVSAGWPRQSCALPHPNSPIRRMHSREFDKPLRRQDRDESLRHNQPTPCSSRRLPGTFRRGPCSKSRDPALDPYCLIEVLYRFLDRTH